eukprot:6173050-Pleurochrysis_carterae.AAC.1
MAVMATWNQLGAAVLQRALSGGDISASACGQLNSGGRPLYRCASTHSRRSLPLTSFWRRRYLDARSSILEFSRQRTPRCVRVGLGRAHSAGADAAGRVYVAGT